MSVRVAGGTVHEAAVVADPFCAFALALVTALRRDGSCTRTIRRIVRYSYYHDFARLRVRVVGARGSGRARGFPHVQTVRYLLVDDVLFEQRNKSKTEHFWSL